jgi:hypothetical protein
VNILEPNAQDKISKRFWFAEGTGLAQRLNGFWATVPF